MWHSLLSYHPQIGYTYTPSVRSRVPFETGGYLVRTNAAGFRSECEFVPQRTPGKSRAIVFGDSMTAGDGVSNRERFSDLIQKSVPNLEVFNYGLAGGGTDQHYLAHRERANVDHDLLIIAVNVEDTSRVNARFLSFQDAKGAEVFYAKPYFAIEKGELSLKNVPVPKRPMTKETLPSEELSHVDCGHRLFPKLQAFLKRFGSLTFLRNVATRLGLRDLAQAVTRAKRMPEYDSADNPSWLLLRKIIEKWVKQSPVPVLLVPIPSWTHYSGDCDPTGYQTRFRELAADLGCFHHDPLPYLLSHTPEQRRSFRFKLDVHFSPRGHQALAETLAPVVQQILLKRSNDKTETGVRRADGFRTTSPSRSAKPRAKSGNLGLNALAMSGLSRIPFLSWRMNEPRAM